MAILRSQISPRSEAFGANAQAHRAAMAPVKEAVALAMLGGGEQAQSRHVSRGKILPRERVSRLLDPGSPFLEVGLFAAHEMYDGASPSAGAIVLLLMVEVPPYQFSNPPPFPRPASGPVHPLPPMAWLWSNVLLRTLRSAPL